ncbi:Hypp6378 [Branchiostoma lanceolatum]|uniref:Hypp6378 protein n=1 Tax=Branchiostoma lanceolatum TaxID=7740 RepID=A0A8J9YTW1_BRALA|nr:Hypp6378 [Branchiostoma lanceolatum]
MQTARTALSVALRICPRTALSTYTRPAAGMALVHTSPPRLSGSEQNCLRPDMPYKSGHGTWSGLDLGLFIGAGLLVTAGLFEQKGAQQTTNTPSDVPPVHYVPSDASQYTGLNLGPQAPQTPAGVLFRSANVPLEKNDNADRNASGSEASTSSQKDQQAYAHFGRSAEIADKTTSAEKACKCPRDVSDETPTAVGPVKMRDKALSTAEDVREAPVKSKTTSGDAVDGGDTKEVFDDAVNERGERSSAGEDMTNHSACKHSLMTANSDISDQKSPSACPLGGGRSSEGNAEKDHDFCGDDVTFDVINTCDLPHTADGEDTEDDLRSRTGETRPRHADFTEAEVIAVTACPVRHDFSGAAREVIGSTIRVTDKTDTEISAEEFLSERDFEYESGHLSQEVPVSPRLRRKLRCAVLYADWREDSQFCHRDDVMTNQRVRFSWFGQEDDDDDLDDVSEVRVYCAVLEGVWREEGGLVENHVTSTTGGDDVMESYYPGHGRRNSIQYGNENWV